MNERSQAELAVFLTLRTDIDPSSTDAYAASIHTIAWWNDLKNKMKRCFQFGLTLFVLCVTLQGNKEKKNNNK